jgi:hypothetical protein
MSAYPADPDHLVRLTFRLPGAIAAPTGPFRDTEGCRLHVDRTGLVRIDGPCRERVQQITARFLYAACRSIIIGALPPECIAALMRTYSGERGRPASDSWQIIVGADIAFAPTGLPAVMVRRSRALEPA